MTQAPPLYALRMMAQGHYMIAKFSMPDFTVEATYNLIAKGTGYACDCPASARVVKYKPCKHQRMLPFMLGAVNTDRFYEPESRSWCQPLAPDLAVDVVAEGEPQVVDGNDEQPAVAHGVSIQQAQARVVEQPQPPSPLSPDCPHYGPGANLPAAEPEKIRRRV